MTATIFEAKTNLSDLVRRAQTGEEVIITSGRDKQPVARLQPIEPRTIKRLGSTLRPQFRPVRRLLGAPVRRGELRPLGRRA